MRFLSRISLVQWHLFSRADLDVVGNAAILGRNRSGKSTLIDLIQAIMAGGSANFYRFNRSAGERTGRSDRTLRGYCLGQLNEHEFLRQEAITHIALCIEDEDGRLPPITIGLSLEATVRDDISITGRFIAEGVKIDTELFVEQTDDGRTRSAPWTVVRGRLESACAAAGFPLRRPDNARNFIRDYMRLLFTRRRVQDPDRFIRAFILALSFEDMRTVEHFARTHLFDAQDIDIGELRESIQRYRQIQREIHELERRLDALRALKIEVDRFDDLLREESLARDVSRLASLIETGGALFQTLRDIRNKSEDLRKGASELNDYDREIRAADDRIENLEAQRAASDASSQRAVVATELKMIERERADVLRRLQARYAAAGRAVQLLTIREQIRELKLGELLLLLDGIQRHGRDSAPPTWPNNPAELDTSLQRVAAIAAERLPSVRKARDEALGLRAEQERVVRSFQDRLERAEKGLVQLDTRTERLMHTLRAEGMAPRALCEVVDVRDDMWRMPAEALLGRDREAIVVDAEHASRAVAILRSGRDDYRGCRVVNTRRLSDTSTTPPADSLASTLESSDALAMRFVIFRLGNVRLATRQEELLSGGRAIMQDGTYHDGIVVEVRRAADFKIGRAAAGLMGDTLRAELRDAREILARHAKEASLVDDVVRRLEQMGETAAPNDALASIVAELGDADGLASECRERLDRITLAIDPELQNALDTAKSQRRSLIEERSALGELVGGLRSDLEALKRQLKLGEGQVGSWFSLQLRRSGFKKSVRALSTFQPVRVKYQAVRGRRLPGRIASDMMSDADLLMKSTQSCQGGIRDLLADYRLAFDDVGAPSGTDVKILADVKPWVEAGIQGLEGNELMRYRRQADEAADHIGRLFRTAFVHELNSRFSGLETEIENLNAALRTRPLHGEIYALRSRVKPEFKALYDLARDSETDDETLKALFSRTLDKDARHADALAQVERLLQDDELDFATYQDYRNYYGFDLVMRDVATKRETSYERRRGVASGAERQVPFYVIIGAALASIYHGTRRMSETNDRGLGLAVFDEAFSKMDGPNQRTLLGFYQDIGLQVILAAPTEKRSTVYENLDSIIDVHRYDDAVHAETVVIKDRARAAMREANPQYLTDEELRGSTTETPNADSGG